MNKFSNQDRRQPSARQGFPRSFLAVDGNQRRHPEAAIEGAQHLRFVEATRFFYDPANRDEVIAILAKETKTTPQIAAATYDLYVKEQVIAPDAALLVDGIKANLDAFVAMGELTSPPPPAAFIDTSFLAGATKPAPPPSAARAA